MKSLIPLTAAALSFVILAAPAKAVGPDGALPACGDAQVISAIEKRFRKASPVHLGRDLAIDAIARIHEHRTEKPNTATIIRRRHCHATAHLSDGRRRAMWYVIEDGWGFAGYGDKVEFCLSGLDPLRVHGGHCRAIR
jgi:hypothetical protein